MSQNSSTETLKEVMQRWRLGGGKGSATLPASAVGLVGKATPLPTARIAGNSSSTSDTALVADAAAEAWVDSQVLAAERAEEMAKRREVAQAPQSSRTNGSFGGLLLADLDQMDEDDDGDVIDEQPKSQDAFNMLFAIPTVVRKSGACVTSRRSGNVERPRRSDANAAAETDAGAAPPAPSAWAFGLDSISGIPQAQSSKATPVSSGSAAVDHHAALGSKTPMVMRPYGLRQARAEEFFDAFALKASDVGTAKTNEQLGPTGSLERGRGEESSRMVVGSRCVGGESGGGGDGQGLPAESVTWLRHSDGIQPERSESRAEHTTERKESSSSRNSKGLREVFDITTLLEGPRPAGAEGATEEDTRRMSSLMDAPIDAFQPAVIVGVAAAGRRSGRGAGNDPATVSVNATAAARHFAVPNSQHTATLRAMVRMLCCAFESFDVRLERSRTEEAEDRASYVESSSAGLTVLPPPPPVESLRPSELEPGSHVNADNHNEADNAHEKDVRYKKQQGKRAARQSACITNTMSTKVDAGKWRVFDAVLELAGGDDNGFGPEEHGADGELFGGGWNGGGGLRSVGQHGKGSASALGMIHRQCRMVGHRPLLRPESRVFDKVMTALTDRPAEPVERDERKKMTSRARAALKKTSHHPVVALALAACLKGVAVSMLMPASHYEMLSLDRHRFFGLSLPFHCSLVLTRSTSESPPCVSHIVIVPGLSVLPLPLRTLRSELGGQFGISASKGTSDGNDGNVFVDDAAQRFEGELQMRNTAHEGFRFHANPLAPRAANSSSPSKGESPRRSYAYNKDALDSEPAFVGSTAAESRRSHSRPRSLRVEEESGFAFGPYPAPHGEVGDGDGHSIAVDDWHVPLDTLEAIMDAYTTQISQVGASTR